VKCQNFVNLTIKLKVGTQWSRVLLEIGDEEINKQDRCCTYNVTLRRSHVTIAAVEKQ
jgi:hypothetical protein